MHILSSKPSYHILLLALPALMLFGCRSDTASIDSFEQCVAAGNPVLESYPRQCRTQDGRLFTEAVQTDLHVDIPQAGDNVRSPLQIQGEARGQWYFEGVFPVELRTTDGTTITEKTVEAQGDWMTTDFVPFTDTIAFSVQQETSATLILRKSNPSGLPSNAEEIHIPLILLPADTNTQSQELAEEYIRSNIGRLSPEDPVLGGTFFVTDLRWEDGMAIVDYEDGHIALRARMQVTVDDEGTVRVPTVTLLERNPPPDEATIDVETLPPIEHVYPGKIVYTTTDPSAQQRSHMQEDCEMRNGTFDTCGNACAADAQVCMEVCAHTCILPPPGEVRFRSTRMLRADDVGVTLRYPTAVIVERKAEGPADAGIQFTFWGPTQTYGTELFDGFMVSITRGTYTVQTLDAYVAQQVDDVRTIGTVVQSPETVMLAEHVALQYIVETLGRHTHYYLSAGKQEYLHITVSVVDPTNQGYEDVVQRMLSSIRVL